MASRLPEAFPSEQPIGLHRVHARTAENHAHGGLDAPPVNRHDGRLDKLVAVPNPDVTVLLQAWSAGDAGARDALMPLVYQELRRRAGVHLRGERRGHTLQPTALVNEVYLRLVDQRRAQWQNRAQFLAVASQMMRRILVDRARGRRMAKRSGRWARVTLEEGLIATQPVDVDVLDTALTRLAQFDARRSQIAELRFFGGLSLEEAGEALGVSLATVERDWQVARAWLFKELRGEQEHDA
jgi:RNA polymerase sigma-70 factor (ECF subfamily)